MKYFQYTEKNRNRGDKHSRFSGFAGADRGGGAGWGRVHHAFQIREKQTVAEQRLSQGPRFSSPSKTSRLCHTFMCKMCVCVCELPPNWGAGC